MFIDNAGCHPEEAVGKYSNIKVCFLRANETSKLHFLILELKNLKKTLSSTSLVMISKIDSCTTASDIVQSIISHVAIQSVALAWSRVNESTIRESFKSAGVLDKDYDVVVLPSLFFEADVQMELESLMVRVVVLMNILKAMTA